MIKSVWIHQSKIAEAETALAMLKAMPEDAEKGPGVSIWRAFAVNGGKMFVQNTPGSQKAYYEMFDWEQHPTYPYIRTGKDFE